MSLIKKRFYLIFCIVIIAACQEKDSQQPTFDVIIDTDLGGDPDDIQSLYRAVHYSDILKIKGIVATPCTQLHYHPWDTVPRVALIKNWIKRIDVNHLRNKGFSSLMKEEELLNIIKLGSESPGAPSDRRSTEGSNWIIEMAKSYSPENPLWVLVWGSMTTTAQALHDAPEIANNIRIYYIGSTNTQHDTASRNYVFDFMANQNNQLWWIENGTLPKWDHETFRGIYESGDQSGEWNMSNFIPTNIRNHGSTHNGLFDLKSGDAFPVAHSPKNSLKEGDSPSMLFLLSPVMAGVGDVNDPTQESWGGQFRAYNHEKYPNYYVDLDAEMKVCMSTIGKWRKDILTDWKSRWDRYN